MKRILSIDGGGIRGVIPAAIVAYIEQQLIHSLNNPRASIVQHFDLFAGTSTGGILSALYLTPADAGRRADAGSSADASSRADASGTDTAAGAGRVAEAAAGAAGPAAPKYSAAEVLEFYRELGPVLFQLKFWQRLRTAWGFAGSKYSVEPLEEFAHKIFGNTYISEVLKDCLITSYDMSSRKAHFFSKHSVAKYGECADYKLSSVVRSTSAAPTFFRPALISARDKGKRHLIDGGVFANNPAMCAYVEGIKLWPNIKPEDEFMLSLGTGKIERPYSYEVTRHFGYLQWLFPVLDILMSSVSEVVDFQLRQIFSLSQVPQNYIRIEPPLEGCSIRMDNASPRNIKALEAVATRWIDHNGHIVDSIIKMLE